MAAPSSPVSDLSALNSEDFDEDANRSRSEREGTSDGFDDNDSAAALPPTKRRRTTKRRVSRHRNHSPANSATGANGPVKHAAVDPDADPDVDMDGYGTDVSSDSSGMGSVDGSSALFKELGMNDEYSYGEEQVQVCRWDYCEAGDLGNQDELVKHINDVHVTEAKQRSFMCEWFDCKAKFRPQMSAYALRAHLRSHTKEKPFFCTLPECDRSFTRSDALAKHMRTVHETEGTRTVEHYNVKKSKLGADGGIDGSTQGDGSRGVGDGASSKPPQKLKLVFNNKSSAPSTPQHATANGASDTGDEETTAPSGPLSPGTRDNLFGPLPDSLQFTEAEAQMPRDQLFRLLRRQLRWATEESEDLAKEIESLEKDKRQEWLNKELVLENVLEAEYSRARRRGVFDANGQDSTFGEMEELDWADNPMSAQEKARILDVVDNDIEVASCLPMKGPGPLPWYRQQAEVEAEARARAAAAAKAKAEARAQADQQDNDEEAEDEDDEDDDDDGGADADAQEDEDMDDEDDEAEAPRAQNEEDEDEDDDENETKVVIMTLGPGGGSGPTSIANDGDDTEEDEENL